MRYYLIRMRDDALIGMRRGVQESRTLESYATREEAYKALEDYRNHTMRNVYFKVQAAESPPEDWSKRYTFKDFDIF